MPINPDRIKWAKPNVAEIIDVKEDYSVKFLKNIAHSSKFLFDKEETYEIGNINIVFKLPKPQSVDASERQSAMRASILRGCTVCLETVLSPAFEDDDCTQTILPAAESSDFARHLVLVLPHHTFNHVQMSSTLATDD
ncbi:hypothetical protein TNCV_3537121 [Trichonephila clavipes]|uniref:Uncharacterized protein n=1 Tax=Trichonephila clavipes TaxID=2585209 RepID=A0A8X6VWL3_TRICX|nr:hypothetical protein TNCV_3537121 [Trichonephila clavipes]